MAITTATSYIDALLRHELVSDDSIQETLGELGATPDTVDPDELSAKLIDKELLTKWQDQQLRTVADPKFFVKRYKLLEHLSSGLSKIYLAAHPSMGRQVAIKILPTDKIADTSHLERFIRECQVLATLDHPNIVRAEDLDVEGDNVYFMVLDYIEGTNLQKLVTDRGPLPYEHAINFIRQAAAGLGHAHEHGLVHRDIKPANLMLDNEGVVKVLDLGMARVSEEECEDPDEPSLTMLRNELLGTADFISPEQILDSHDVDHRADIYSLGCTFYYLVAAKPPFDHASMAQKIMAHHSEAPPRLKNYRPDVPPNLEVAIYRMMAKQPDSRPQTMDEVIRGLDELATGLSH